ncbi:peptide deformylase [Paucilactobacillus kaifaensis]|uniref:peptide deformylase n=1 Tax=Paucilactobacillus kaifaensis TaxID=2559921 RepID=UPI0010FA2D30|nr:peptide deformylase [Paucilactobacillus kaifaensis]
MIKTINRDTTSLAKSAVKATRADKQVITDLIDTLKFHEDHCVGMAANMIGINKRIIIVQMGMLGVPMINPLITNKTGSYQTTEGCLSLAGQRTTTRFTNITVQYLDQNFIAHEQQFSGLIAQIIQHEVDHCDGIII